MANNDKLNKILSNLQILSDLTKSMLDSEMYPVSFFSQAFDLIQKLQTDFHSVESEQVTLFATQMKEHQALIMAIHNQMRNFGTEPNETESYEAPPPKAKPVKPTPKPAEPKTVEQKQVEQQTVEPKPVEPKPEPRPEPKKPQQISVGGLEHKDFKSNPDSFLNRIGARDTEKKDPEKRAKSPIIESPIIEPKTAYPEDSAPPSMNDIIEKKRLADLRKAFSINDRFRYRHELFKDDEALMNRTIATLNGKETLQDSLLYLEENLQWDFNNPEVKSFIKVLKIRFL